MFHNPQWELDSAAPPDVEQGWNVRDTIWALHADKLDSLFIPVATRDRRWFARRLTAGRGSFSGQCFDWVQLFIWSAIFDTVFIHRVFIWSANFCNCKKSRIKWKQGQFFRSRDKIFVVHAYSALCPLFRNYFYSKRSSQKVYDRFMCNIVFWHTCGVLNWVNDMVVVSKTRKCGVNSIRMWKFCKCLGQK